MKRIKNITYPAFGGVLSLMLLVVSSSPSALTEQSRANPRSQLRQCQKAKVNPIPHRAFGIDESVTWQNSPVHDGFNPVSPLVPPLGMKWSRDFSASGVDTIS
jgi:hypothetical protein